MSEPLTEEQLREHRETAELLERSIGRPWFYESPPHVRAGDAERGVVAIRALLAEVERLKAREADLVADLKMIEHGLVKRINDMGDEMARDFGGYPEGLDSQ